MSIQVEIDHDRVAEVCRRNPIKRLAFFGSVPRDDFDPRGFIGRYFRDEVGDQAEVELVA